MKGTLLFYFYLCLNASDANIVMQNHLPFSFHSNKVYTPPPPNLSVFVQFLNSEIPSEFAVLPVYREILDEPLPAMEIFPPFQVEEGEVDIVIGKVSLIQDYINTQVQQYKHATITIVCFKGHVGLSAPPPPFHCCSS